MQVGFAGLGAMGSRMVRTLAEAGHELTVYNRTRAKTEPFQMEGFPVADSPRELAAGADVVAVMVTDDDALASLLDGPDGLPSGIGDGNVLINHSTVSRAAATAAQEEVTERGATFVDAPVSGTLPQAESGSLSVLVGSDDETLERVSPLLDALGTVTHCGPIGAGTDMKLAVNLLLGAVNQGLSEALTFATAHGIDATEFLDVVAGGSLNSPYVEVKGASIAAREFEPLFTLDLLHKDLSLVLEAGGAVPVPLPLTAAARETAAAGRALGHGSEDMSAVVTYFEQFTGTPVGTRDADEQNTN
jgi:3-hydroxyisobutyrate dehydrogenase-like beta-hydroxyacid dehydrogenase